MGMSFREFDPHVLEQLKLDFTSPHARVNHGTVLLSWFIDPPKGSRTVLELGSGSGAISIFLAKTFGLKATGLEIDRNLRDISVKNSYSNCVQELTTFINCNIEEYLRDKSEEVYDVVIANPPHFVHSGVESPDERRNIARRTDRESARIFAFATGRLLKNRGAFFFLLHPRDMTKWFRLLEDQDLGIHRIRFAHGSLDKQAQLVLLSGRKGSSSEVVVEPPIEMR